MSPVHDSLQVTWSVLDVPLGRTTETFASVTRAMLKKLSVLPECIDQLRSLEAEPLGVYAVRKIVPARAGGSSRYLLREIATERKIWVQFLEAYDIRAADFVLVRPTPLPPDRAEARAVSHVCFTTPYVCEGVSYAAWRDYYEDQADAIPPGADPTTRSQILISRSVQLLSELGSKS